MLYHTSPNSNKFMGRQSLIYSRLAQTLSRLRLSLPCACMDHGAPTTLQPLGFKCVSRMSSHVELSLWRSSVPPPKHSLSEFPTPSQASEPQDLRCMHRKQDFHDPRLRLLWSRGSDGPLSTPNSKHKNPPQL